MHNAHFQTSKVGQDARKKVILPELGGIDDLVLVEGLGDIISGVELGGPGGRGLGCGGLRVRGEGASVLSLDGPQAPLVVGLGPAVAADAPDELLVTAGSRGLRHRCLLSVRSGLGFRSSVADALATGKESKPRPPPAFTLLSPKP